jgi:hypothetical protein
MPDNKPEIHVTLRASGMRSDGVRIEAAVEGPADQFENMRRKLDDLLYRNEAQPIPQEGEEKLKS